jgi:endonuclease/exonuclease/phosphatase family metal-dependent hydrolase
MSRPDVSVVAARERRLPWRLGRHRRGVATALLDFGGRRVAVASVHMSLYADERARHLPLVLAEVDRHGVPAVVAGDINETAEGVVWRELAARFQDGYVAAPKGDGLTFSTIDPRRRIDAVFADRSLTVLSCGVPVVEGLEQASDHRPVLAVLNLTPPPS